MFEFDEVDQQILNRRLANRETLSDPQMGDFVRFPTGQLERVSSILGDRLQTSPVRWGSFHLFSCGRASFSGGLNPSIAQGSLSLTDEKVPGEFWFFHHGETGAHRGVYFKIPCRVFATTEPYCGYLS